MMRILIVDDEPLARQRLHNMVQSQVNCEVVGEAVNGVDALEKTQQLSPDLILLDIRMPGMDGLEAAKHLDLLDNPPAIIFITAYNEYALEAFDVHAIGYLVKPVRAEQLKKAIVSASRPALAKLATTYDFTTQEVRKYISARVRDSIKLIPVSDIYYFQAEHKYVVVRYTEGEVLIEESLKKLEDEFSEDFLRIHRNALVAKNRLSGFSKNNEGQWQINFQDINNCLEVSRRHISHVLKVVKHL